MEERPKQTQGSSENEARGHDDKANPGEIFLKKWIGLSEKRESKAEPNEEKIEKNHFAESFRGSLMPKLVSKETPGAIADSEVFYDRLSEGGEETNKVEEAQFDKRHEIKSSQDPGQAVPQEAEPLPPSDDKNPPSDMHHISRVIGEKAKDIQKTKRQETASGQDLPIRTKKQSTASQFARPVLAGAAAAIAILILVLIANALAQLI